MTTATDITTQTANVQSALATLEAALSVIEADYSASPSGTRQAGLSGFVGAFGVTGGQGRLQLIVNRVLALM